MEKVTLTKLYEVLAQKVGRNEAECLTQYVEIKVKEELNTKTEILATKLLVKEESQKLREEIHGLRNELRGEIHGLRNELRGEIHGLRNELREEIHGLRHELTGEIHGFRTEMKDHSLALQKWMLAIFITIVTMMMGLYAAYLFKH